MVELGSTVGKATQLVYGIQKATLFKRFSAWLFDFIITLVIATGIFAMFSVIVDYDGAYNRINEIYEEYSQTYGINLKMDEETFNGLSEADKEKYMEANKALSEDQEMIAAWNLVINFSISGATIGILVAVLITELIIPLILKNGQTIGKKIFQLVVVSKNCVKIRNNQLVIRTIFGKFTVDTMIPLYLTFLSMFGGFGILGMVIVFGIFAVNITMVLTRYDRGAIHDLMAVTVVCDKNAQMIFESEEALIAFKNEHQLAESKKSSYTL